MLLTELTYECVNKFVGLKFTLYFQTKSNKLNEILNHPNLLPEYIMIHSTFLILIFSGHNYVIF